LCGTVEENAKDLTQRTQRKAEKRKTKERK
jgi:hypothetical protein